MRKAYMKPVIEIEAYELNASIASNCGTKVTFGPGTIDEAPCKEFEDSWEVFSVIPGVGIQSTGGTPFYADGEANCDCYHSSGGGVFFTS